MVGMGTFGWTEEQTLQTRIPSIEIAAEGFWKTQNAIHGGGEPAKPKVSERSMTPALFDALFGGK